MVSIDSYEQIEIKSHHNYSIIKDFRIRGISGEGLWSVEGIYRNRNPSRLVLYNGTCGEAMQKILGKLPPGKFPPESSTPVYSPKECSPPKKPHVFLVFSCVASVCSSLRSR